MASPQAIARNELHLGFHQAADEMNVAGKAVEAGNDERRLVALAGGKILHQFGSVAALATFHLSELSDQLHSPPSR